MKIERSPIHLNVPPYRIVLQDGYQYCSTLEEAIREARAYAHPGETIKLPDGECAPFLTQAYAYCPHCGHKL